MKKESPAEFVIRLQLENKRLKIDLKDILEQKEQEEEHLLNTIKSLRQELSFVKLEKENLKLIEENLKLMASLTNAKESWKYFQEKYEELKKEKENKCGLK